MFTKKFISEVKMATMKACREENKGNKRLTYYCVNVSSNEINVIVNYQPYRTAAVGKWEKGILTVTYRKHFSRRKIRKFALSLHAIKVYINS